MGGAGRASFSGRQVCLHLRRLGVATGRRILRRDRSDRDGSPNRRQPRPVGGRAGYRAWPLRTMRFRRNLSWEVFDRLGFPIDLGKF